MELISPLPRDECVRRLKSLVDPSLLIFGSKPLKGGVAGWGFHVRRRIWYQNSFQTWMSGSFESHGTGTRIRCNFGMHPFTLVFLAVWFGIFALIGGPLVLAVLGAFLEDPQAMLSPGALGGAFPAAIPIGMMAFAAALVGFGRLLASGERAYLEAVLRRTLEAADV